MSLSVKVSAALALVAAIGGAAAQPAQDAAIADRIRARYPNTQFRDVRQTAVPGVYEVVMGTNVAYVDASGRYFFFGRLFDMEQQRDLTEPRIRELEKIDIGTLPLEHAIKSVRGSGARTLVVFSDPDCPYCRRLEKAIDGLQDVTVYTFLFPLTQLHQDARRKAVAVWCAHDRAQAWRALMLDGVEPKGPSDCAHPVDSNIALAQRMGVRGTPTLFSGDGRRATGAMSTEALNAFLEGGDRIAGRGAVAVR